MNGDPCIMYNALRMMSADQRQRKEHGNQSKEELVWIDLKVTQISHFIYQITMPLTYHIELLLRLLYQGPISLSSYPSTAWQHIPFNEDISIRSRSTNSHGNSYKERARLINSCDQRYNKGGLATKRFYSTKGEKKFSSIAFCA